MNSPDELDENLSIEGLLREHESTNLPEGPFDGNTIGPGRPRRSGTGNQIQRTASGKPSDSDDVTGGVRRSVEQTLSATRSIGWTRDIVKGAIRGVLSGPGPTETDRTPNNGGTIMPEGNAGIGETRQEGPATAAIIPSMDSGQRLPTLSEGASESENLLTDTAKHLHGLMKGLTANKPAFELRALEPETANAAANLGKQISSLMRLKLDALKFKKELEGK